ncbi:MAG: hypothetical protein QOD31_4001 [Pseudonocardiales bacterium]|nr:hypothetical protein [Pseudonocardiales bacterium]
MPQAAVVHAGTSQTGLFSSLQYERSGRAMTTASSMPTWEGLMIPVLQVLC